MKSLETGAGETEGKCLDEKVNLWEVLCFACICLNTEKELNFTKVVKLGV